jgi:hypothetical protein
MPLLIKEQLTDAWKQAHIGKISASTAAGCLGYGMHGMSKIKTWKKIMGTLEEDDNWYKQYGVRNEAKAIEAYEAFSGILMFKTGFWVHPKITWLGASPDGLCEDGVLETKCPQTMPTGICPHCYAERGFLSRRCDFCDDVGIVRKVPEAHLIQCAVAMAVCDKKWCDYCVWSRYEIWVQRIDRNPLFEEMVLKGLTEFYTEYVSKNVCPPRKKPVKKPADFLFAEE